MSNLFNIVLIAILVIAIVSPFVIIPCILFYNSIIKKYQLKVNREISDKNVKAFIKVLKIGPLLKYDKKWELLNETFYKVNKSKKVSIDSKKELYQILSKKGCKIEGVSFSK